MIAPGYAIEYRPGVERDFRALPVNVQRRILRAIESRLGTSPDRYGKKLTRSLRGLWRLCIGDYRVVYEIRKRTVTVLLVCHRRDAYDEAQRRWFSEGKG